MAASECTPRRRSCVTTAAGEGAPPPGAQGTGGGGHTATQSTEVAGPFELLCPSWWHRVLAKYLFKSLVPANMTLCENRVFAETSGKVRPLRSAPRKHVMAFEEEGGSGAGTGGEPRGTAEAETGVTQPQPRTAR